MICPQTHKHGERWRDVPGYGGAYVASSCGRIWSRRKGRLLKPSVAGAGYLRVGLPAGSGRTTSGYVHRMVCAAFHGAPASGEEVRHLDGDPKNNHAGNAGRTHTIVDGTGTRRRLQALCAIGWTFIEIGRMYGMTRQGVRELAYAERVRDDTAERVRRIYDDLSMRVPEPRSGYERGSAIKARNHAARMGWPPPLAWDDEDLDRPDARPAQRKDAA